MTVKSRKRASAHGVAIANHCAIATALQVLNLLRLVFFVRRGPLGLGLPTRRVSR